MSGLSYRLMLGALVVAASACAGSSAEPPPPEAGRMLTAQADTVWIHPGGAGAVPFALRTLAGAPIPNATVTFAIVDDPDRPGVDAQGATLASATGITDESGLVAAQVTAGLLTTFLVRATSGDAEAEEVVTVAVDVVGSIDVAPFFAPGSRAAPLATTIEVLFFENSSCVDISPRKPPTPVRPLRRLAPDDAVTRFDYVTTGFSHAVLGRARDGSGGLLAFGCVDLPGRVLVAGAALQVALPLGDASPDPVGAFDVTSTIAIAPAPAAAAAMAAPWRDLGDCPLDPAQLWLDCTADALGGAAPDDPLDCVPVPGGEGALGDALAARRGTFLTGADGRPTACRGPHDGGGATSADALLLGLYGGPLPPAVVSLGAIADDAAHLLDRLTVRSGLVVRPGTSDGVYEITHTLVDVVFGAHGALKEVPLEPFGLPALSADATATVSDGALVVGAHGMTLRLGAAARVAFGTLGLEQRALPGTAAGFVAALAGLAHSDDGAHSGCDALDGALCAALARPAGCLAAACQAGLTALAARLDAAFDAADGGGLDLYLSGSAPLFDRHGNGAADRIGDTQATPPDPGTWSVDLLMSAGRVQASGTWEADRSGN